MSHRKSLPGLLLWLTVLLACTPPMTQPAPDLPAVTEVLLASPTPAPTHTPTVMESLSPFEAVRQMQRGLNMGNTLEAPREGEWGFNFKEKAEIDNRFDLVAAWAKQSGIPVYLGEFGAYSKADMDSRVRWTTYVREQAEARGFAWAYWEFGAGFGVYDRDAREWQDELLRALIP